MRALVTNGSHTLDGIDIVERATPVPGGGQVLIRVSAVSLNYRDLLVVGGKGRWRPPVGRIPCSDACGVVAAVGSDVEGLQVGDRVISTVLPNWLSGPLSAEKLTGSLGGSAADGVLAEFVVLPARSVVRVGDGLTAAELATLPCAALTAWQSVVRASSLDPGRTMLLQGTGGVSLFALQFAVASGVRAVITSSSDEKLARAIDLGAAAGVNYRTAGDWVQEALAIEPKGYDHVIDVGGASTLSHSIQLVAYEGTVSVVGLIGGLEATLDITPVFAKNIRIDGIEVGSREMLVEMVAWIETHGIRPVVDRTFDLDGAADALRHLASGAHFGKVVISLEGTGS